MNLLPFALGVSSCAPYVLAMSLLGKMLARCRESSCAPVHAALPGNQHARPPVGPVFHGRTERNSTKRATAL
jgi:hypothetical protein